MSTQTHLRIRDYDAGTAMAPHHHEEALLSIVVRGDFQERIGGSERNYARGHVAFCPAGVTHDQSFGVRGARQVTFRPRDEWVDYLADCKAPLNQAPYVGSATFSYLGLVDEVLHP